MENKNEPEGLFIGELSLGNVFDSDVKRLLEILWMNGYQTKPIEETNSFEIYEINKQ